MTPETRLAYYAVNLAAAADEGEKNQRAVMAAAVELLSGAIDRIRATEPESMPLPEKAS